MMNYPVTHHLCVMLRRCSQRWKGKALLIRLFSAIELGRGRRRAKEGDVTKEDEDDEDGIRFVTLESRFENKETVLGKISV